MTQLLPELAKAQRYPALSLVIDGRHIGAGERQTLDVIDPATREVLAKLPVATREDLDAALEAAERGFRIWRGVSAFDRARILRRAADLIRERAETIARWLTLEEGKPFSESLQEVVHGAEIIEWSGEEARRNYGRAVPARRPDLTQVVVHEPIGPVAAFAPWNFPAVTPARKLGGALAAGCSIILKPAEETPGTALAFVQALLDAGVPPSAVAMVTGDPAMISSHLIASPVIRKISFTGSTAVGKHLAALAAQGVKRATLELGGHAPVVICDDIDDVKSVAQVSLIAKIRNAGQVCASPTRFFVQQGIYDDFLQHFTDAARALRIGHGLDEATQMGPLANERRLTAMSEFVADAVGRGATVAAGGDYSGAHDGFFFVPAILTDVPAGARVLCEEPFGPVVPVVRFTDLDEVIERANAVPWGLTAYAFTSRVDRARELGARLEAGVVGINHFAIASPEVPFGGIKESGYGSESGPEGVEAYLTTKLISTLG
ncbi:MAG TPA: NAD-dependent succinate-semialdehyde dehydrogenase [Candidatus Acidoferrales bacterium]|nr:NAD-dependent succinate-semialdehyde dehydrogenase [Candidatus Acidoferrales bacterium]